MIVKSGKGYQVKSESGSKNLSKPGLSKKQAQKRLQQVEYFKHHMAETQAKMHTKG
jgi:hypothetical protein